MAMSGNPATVKAGGVARLNSGGAISHALPNDDQCPTRLHCPEARMTAANDNVFNSNIGKAR